MIEENIRKSRATSVRSARLASGLQYYCLSLITAELRIMFSEMSLQAKGMLAFAVLTIYAAGLTLFVLDQKEALIAEVEQLRAVYERDEAVSRSDLATLRTLQNLGSQILVQSSDLDKEGLRDQLALVRVPRTGPANV